MDVIYEDEGLWDELSHQQSREIEQHHRQQQQQPLYHPSSNHRRHHSPPSHHHSHRQGGRHLHHHQQQYPLTNSAGGNLEIVAEAVQRGTRRVVDEVSLLAQQTYQAASQAYQEYQQNQQHRNHNQHYYHAAPTMHSSNNNNALDEFGISTTSDEHNLSNNPHHDRSRRQQDPLLSQQQQQPSTTRNGFVFLTPWQRHHNNPQDAWGTVANLDLFLTQLYAYYYHGGLVPIIGKGLVELVTLFLTCVLSVFLARHVHWQLLLTCTDETTCQANFSDYLLPNEATANDSWTWTIWSRWIVSLYVYIFSAYGLFSLWTLGQSVADARHSKWIFEQRLGIPAHKLQAGAVEWDTICEKLMQLQATGEYRIAIPRGGERGRVVAATTTTTAAAPVNNPQNNETTTASVSGMAQSTNTTETTTTSDAAAAAADAQALDALMIAHRILRKENFLVALFNKGLLDMTVPWWLCGSNNPSDNDNIVKTLYCPTLEWSLYFCILNFMWNHKYHVRPAFYLDSQALSRRFVLCGIAHAIFMPFLLFFMTLHFALQNAYDYKSTKQYLGPREWSPVAKWTFREFNELPHIFERRLAPSYQAAEDYLKLFTQSEFMTAVGRILVFAGGSCGAVLFVFAALNDAILLHVKIADWNLLWYAGVVGVVYSIGKALLPNGNVGQPRRYVRNMYVEMDTSLRQVTNHTHYYPQVWQARGWDKSSTHRCFSAMFQYKANLFVHQVMSTVLAPYVLCVSLPQCSEAICEFVLAVKTELPADAGEVCGFATFDFDKFRDETWEGRTLGQRQGDSSIMTTGSLSDSILRFGQSVQEATRQHPKPQARHGKMEKSFFSFKAAHPNWKCPPSGQHLVDRVEHYRQEETAAISREQQLHLEAAARQLETLARMEQGKWADHNASTRSTTNNGFSSSARPLNAVVDESYYRPKTQSTAADAGAGMTFPSTGLQPQPAQPSTSVPPMAHTTIATEPTGPATPRVPPPEAFSRMTTVESEEIASFPIPVQQPQQHGQEHQQPPDLNREDGAPPFAISSSHPTVDLVASPNQQQQQQQQQQPTSQATAPTADSQQQSIPPRHSSAFGDQDPTFSISHRSSLMQQQQQQQQPNSNAALSLGLSSELRRILNMSTLDPDVSLLMGGGGSVHHNQHYSRHLQEVGEEERQRAEQQYLWLERYHSHVAAQQDQLHQSSASEPVRPSTTSTARNSDGSNGAAGGPPMSGSSIV